MDVALFGCAAETDSRMPLMIGKLFLKPGPSGIGSPSQTTWIPCASSSRVTPSTRRRYSAFHAGVPSRPTFFPFVTPAMKSCASSAPNENTTTFGLSFPGATLMRVIQL